MSPDLIELSRVAPPPPTVKEFGYSPNWSAIERQLGMQFPADFRDLADLYGPGEFCDQVVVFVPWEDNAPDPQRHASFADRFMDSIRHLNRMRDDLGLLADVPIWPDSGGIVPLGGITTGSDLFWVMDGPDPDKWPCAETSQSMELQLHECNLTQLLVRWLSGELHTDYLDSEILDLPSGPYFESLTGKSRVDFGVPANVANVMDAMDAVHTALRVPSVLWSQHVDAYGMQERRYVPQFDWSLTITISQQRVDVGGRVSPNTYDVYDEVALRLATALGASPSEVTITRNWMPPDVATN